MDECLYNTAALMKQLLDNKLKSVGVDEGARVMALSEKIAKHLEQSNEMCPQTGFQHIDDTRYDRLKPTL